MSKRVECLGIAKKKVLHVELPPVPVQVGSGLSHADRPRPWREPRRGPPLT